MTTVLLIFSLCLHLIAFYLIIIMGQRITHLKSESSDSVREDIDAALAAHLVAVRSENDALLERLKTSGTLEKELSPQPRSEPVLAKEDPKGAISFSDMLQKEESKSTPVPPFEEIQDRVEQSLAASVLQLHESGHHIDDIAKVLNKGKGEVELILNIHHKEKG